MTLKTEDVIVISEEDNSIMLNCTFRKDSNERISSSDIRWQKQMGEKFTDVAAFSLPGDDEPFILNEMLPLYNKRTELIGPNTSLSAVMIIKDPICSDVGIYRCWIEYVSPGSIGKPKTSLSTVLFNGRDIYILLKIKLTISSFGKKNQ